MTDLRFAVEGAEAVEHAAAPLVALRLRVSAAGRLRGAFVRCQVQIDAVKRAYDPGERERLAELFGGPSVWERGIRPLHWATVTLLVPAFEDKVVVDVELPCSQELCAAAARFGSALSGGSLPLRLFFSGTVFASDEEGRAQLLPIPLSREACFDLPVSIWLAAMAAHAPGSVFVAIRRELAQRLDQVRLARGLTSVDQVLERLLEGG